jgi:hypothetical protein
MNTKKKKKHTRTDSFGRKLFALELRIARRADELAKTIEPALDQNFEYWLRAEREVLARS